MATNRQREFLSVITGDGKYCKTEGQSVGRYCSESFVAKMVAMRSSGAQEERSDR